MIQKNLAFLGYSKYSVDSNGNIYSTQTWRGQEKGKLNPSYNNKYLLVKMINDDKKRCCEYVARLVAKCFVEGETAEKNEVDHINRIRDDNRAENLRWVTREENMNNTTIQKPIYSFNAKTGESVLYKSTAEASKITNIPSKDIAKAIFGHGRKDSKTAHGFYWILVFQLQRFFV